MRRFNLVCVTVTTILVISALYTPQPLLPTLRAAFGVSPPTAALLITVAMLPLGVAPLVYGLLLGKISPLTMTRVAVLLLALSQAAIAVTDSFGMLLGLRLLQGLCIPAALTALMTTMSSESTDQRLERTMALYVSATIVGGFCGRFVSGVVAAFFGWRAAFATLGLALLLNFALLLKLKIKAAPGRAEPLSLSRMRLVLGRPGFLRVYLTIFCLFFVFAAVVNFLPFRLSEFSTAHQELRAAFVYLGYLAGLAASLSSTRMVPHLGGSSRAMLLGLLAYLGSVLLFLIPLEFSLYLTMFLFCGSMFFVHSTAPGLLNARERRQAGVVNGLYIAFYYLGGTFGSWLPGYVYRLFGWHMFVLLLSAMLLVSVFLASGTKRQLERPAH